MISTTATVLNKGQKEIFERVKAFVLENRNAPSPSHYRAAKLALPNLFPAKDRQFITKLSEDLHLSVQWDEYDEQDQNLVTWRFPRALEDSDSKEGEEAGNDSEWEDTEEDPESRVAVDRVLKKYEKAPVADPEAEGSFDERHARNVKEKMDEWKRGYYQVCFLF